MFAPPAPRLPSRPGEDRGPLSRALNPPQRAPLQHINSGTGTNCPTLDVLETQIASAASLPQTPNTPPQTEENLQKKNHKIGGFYTQSSPALWQNAFLFI